MRASLTNQSLLAAEAQDGKTDPETRRAGLLQSTVLMWAFWREIRPAAVQAVLPALAVIGQLLGYRPKYLYPHATRTAPVPLG